MTTSTELVGVSQMFAAHKCHFSFKYSYLVSRFQNRLTRGSGSGRTLIRRSSSGLWNILALSNIHLSTDIILISLLRFPYALMTDLVRWFVGHATNDIYLWHKYVKISYFLLFIIYLAFLTLLLMANIIICSMISYCVFLNP